MNGYFVPVGKANAHLKRSEYLIELREILPESKTINEQYSTFKDLLHCMCFYTSVDPELFEKIFFDVEPFLNNIKELLGR
ncbi:MAG: hypothetical protein ACXAC7_06920 [Candidatus Hodarchaeales archaeon]|jgi:hypothetical protein